MFRSRFLMAAFVAAIAALAGPATSQAGFQVSAVVGGSSATITDNNSANFIGPGSSGVFDTNAALGTIKTPTIPTNPSDPISGTPFTVGGAQIGLSTSSASSVSQSSLTTTSDVVVRNTTNGQITLTLTVSNSYLFPLNVHMKLNQALTILDIIDKNGVLYDRAIHTSDSVNSVASANPTLTSTSSIGSDQHFDGSSSTTYTRTSTFFTLSQTFTIVLQAGEAVDFQGSAKVNSIPGDNLLITPAPAGLILAASGLPFLGLLRRRLRRTETTVAA